jgi:hypothetical protein
LGRDDDAETGETGRNRGYDVGDSGVGRGGHRHRGHAGEPSDDQSEHYETTTNHVEISLPRNADLFAFEVKTNE